MGGVLSLGGLACCFGSAACSLCSCLPSCRSSTSARFMYAGMLLLGSIVACLMLVPWIQEKLAESNWFCTGLDTATGKEICKNLKAATGFEGVYRMCFAMTMFFLLMSLIMIRVRSSKDIRSGLQNGFWFFKYLALIGIAVGAFFIKDAAFGTTWMYFGLIGGFLFILIQLVCIVDFFHSVAQWLNERNERQMEDNESKQWMAVMVSLSGMAYLGAIGFAVILFVFYTLPHDCTTNKVVISVNLILCVVLSVISILPKIQDRITHSGLLQASMMSLYIMYMTWSGLLSNPYKPCNPSMSDIFNGTAGPGANFTGTDKEKIAFAKPFSVESILSLIIMFGCVLYACIRISTNSSYDKLTGSGGEESTTLPANSDPENGEGSSGGDKEKEKKKGQKVYDDEEENVAYNYSFLHLMFALGSLYVMMTLTAWYKPDGNLKHLQLNDASYWVKISSGWACMAIYAWTLVVPLVFPDRLHDSDEIIDKICSRRQRMKSCPAADESEVGVGLPGMLDKKTGWAVLHLFFNFCKH